MNFQALALVSGILVLSTGSLIQGKQGKSFLPSLFSSTRERRYDPIHDECGATPDDRQECGRRADALNKWQCKARGCCWDDTDRLDRGTIRCFLAARMLTEECDVDYTEKIDCGYYEISEGECLARGCCWRPSPRENDPECYTKVPEKIRLINEGAESSKEGRIEVYYDNTWGTVCDDGFGQQEADVICRELGYASGMAKDRSYYGIGRGKIWLDELYCVGNETSIGRCRHAPWGEHDCQHREDVGVTCYEEGEESDEEASSNSGGNNFSEEGNGDTLEDFLPGFKQWKENKVGKKQN